MYCSPTRSSFLSGRLPYHVNQVNIGGYYPASGIARNMTCLPKKLKQAGYSTHAFGSEGHLPRARPLALPACVYLTASASAHVQSGTSAWRAVTTLPMAVASTLP